MAKNVLVTATTFPRWKGDTEPSFVFYLSRLLAEKGHNVIVLAPHFKGAKRFEVMDGVKVHRFRYFLPEGMQRLCYEGGILENMKKSFLARMQAPFLLVSELFSIRRILKKEKIGIIHAHWIIPQGLIAALLRRRYGVKVISTAHAGDVFPLKKRLFRRIAAYTIRNSDYVTVNSSYTKDAINKIKKAKNISVIPMGVDLQKFNPKNKKEAIKKKLGIKKELILSVGRLAEKKGIKYLVMAMPKVLERFQDARLVIVGDGPEKERISRMVSDLSLGKNIMLPGKIRNEELPSYYAAADLFAGPSIVTATGDTEGLGVVFLEALASGTAVVGSDVGGIPDIIKHEKTGLLVREKDPNGLASAIIRMLSDRRLREKTANAGRKHVLQNYSWDKVADNFDKIINKI